MRPLAVRLFTVKSKWLMNHGVFTTRSLEMPKSVS